MYVRQHMTHVGQSQYRLVSYWDDAQSLLLQQLANANVRLVAFVWMQCSNSIRNIIDLVAML